MPERDGSDRRAEPASELDCLRGILPVPLLHAAERRSRELNLGADQVLIQWGVISEEKYVAHLARHLSIDFDDLSTVGRAHCPLADADLPEIAEFGILPVQEGDTLNWIVTPRAFTARRLTRFSATYPSLIARIRLTTRRHLHQYLTEQTGDALSDIAAEGLLQTRPAMSAKSIIGWRRGLQPAILLLVCAVLALLYPTLAMDLIGGLAAIWFLAFSLLRLTCVLVPPQPEQRFPPLRDDQLPIYSVERVESQPACGHPVMMVLDEFPALKRMRVLENAAAQIAGFGVKLVFVAQTLGQLKDNYQDNWETLIANAGLKLFFCNDDNFTREYVSKSIGEREIIRTLVSGSKSIGTTESLTAGVSRSTSVTATATGGSSSSSTTRSESYTEGRSETQTVGISQSLYKRSLVTPDEVGRLFGNPDYMMAIALVSGYQPMMLRRMAYFKDIVVEGRHDRHRDHPPPPTKPMLRVIKPRREEQRKANELNAYLLRCRRQEEIYEQAARLQEDAERRRRESEAWFFWSASWR